MATDSHKMSKHAFVLQKTVIFIVIIPWTWNLTILKLEVTKMSWCYVPVCFFGSLTFCQASKEAYVFQRKLLLWCKCMKITISSQWFNQKLCNTYPMLELTRTQFYNEGVVPRILHPFGGHQFHLLSGHQMPDKTDVDECYVFTTGLKL
jgi:hypothetical protein